MQSGIVTHSKIMSAKRSLKAQGLEGTLSRQEEEKRGAGEEESTKAKTELGTCSAKLGERRGKKKKTKKRTVVDDRPLEDVSMTAEEEKELRGWLRREFQDPDFKRVDPVKLNHAFLKFMAQVPMLLKLKPLLVQKHTGLTPLHQRKLRPHVNPMDDTQVALASSARWDIGLHLNPVHVLDWVMRHAASLMMLLTHAEA